MSNFSKLSNKKKTILRSKAFEEKKKVRKNIKDQLRGKRTQRLKKRIAKNRSQEKKREVEAKHFFDVPKNVDEEDVVFEKTSESSDTTTPDIVEVKEDKNWREFFSDFFHGDEDQCGFVTDTSDEEFAWWF
jgi:hypothetical protein